MAALVAKRTAAAGGADATVTTAAGVWGVIDALLIAAGWTVAFDFTTAVVPYGPSTSPTPGPQVDIAFSAGQVVETNGNRYQANTAGLTAFSPGTGPAGITLTIADRSGNWRYLSSAGAADKVYTSTGESGNERLFIRVNYSTAAALSAPVVNIYFYQYWSGVWGYNTYGPNIWSLQQLLFTAGNTVNYAMVANKNGFCGVTLDSAGAKRGHFGGGLLTRPPGTINTFFVANASVTAGANKTFNFSSGNPVSAGYKIGDRIFVVSQEAGSGTTWNSNIPVYAAVITALTTSSITIDQAQEDTQAGAFVGADPQPLFYFDVANISDNIGSGNTMYMFYRWTQNTPNLFLLPGSFGGTAGRGYVNAAGVGALGTQAPAEMDPNNRTGRVVIGETAVINNDNEICGIVPFIFSQPRATDAFWTIGRSVKESTNYDYVTFLLVPSPTTGRRLCLGPIAISGSAGYTVDLYKMDANTWIEAEPTGPGNRDASTLGAVDRCLQTYTVGRDGFPLQGELLGPNQAQFSVTDILVDAVILPNTIQNGIDRTLSATALTGENVPADSSSGPTGGSGNGSFNSGLN